MVRAIASLNHLLVPGGSLKDVTEFGALLGDGFSQITLAESVEPLARAACAYSDQSLVSVVLWRDSDEAVRTPLSPRSFIVSLDGTLPKGVVNGSPGVFASGAVALLQASIALLVARGRIGALP